MLRCCAATAPRLHVRDDRETPLLTRRDARRMRLIWGRRKAEYFYREIWTGRIALKARAKFDFWRKEFSLSPSSLRGDATGPRFARPMTGSARARNPCRSRTRGEMDSGLALRAPRNDGESVRYRRMTEGCTGPPRSPAFHSTPAVHATDTARDDHRPRRPANDRSGIIATLRLSIQMAAALAVRRRNRFQPVGQRMNRPRDFRFRLKTRLRFICNHTPPTLTSFSNRLPQKRRPSTKELDYVT
jgi:hypothetical protein